MAGCVRDFRLEQIKGIDWQSYYCLSLNKMPNIRRWVLLPLGGVLIATYYLAFRLGDLRKNTATFEIIFFAAFILYGISCLYVLRSEIESHSHLFWIFGLAAVMQGILILLPPTLSDDMYRYVWDGRVQSHSISPYQYPPNAPELSELRDPEIYPSINRKSSITVYPPAAEALFALIWRIIPDSFQWFQVVMALGGLSAGLLLVGLLRDLGRSLDRVLLYLWSPLLAFETAHAAHLDGLVLPMIVGAWWARVRKHDALVGFLLGVATAMKFYPALLLPFLWRARHKQGRWTMPLTFSGTVAAFYIPYLLKDGGAVLGFLPKYFQETFNVSPFVKSLGQLLDVFNWHSPNRIIFIALSIILLVVIWAILNPAQDAETAIKRCILPIGIITLFSQNLFPWYMLWLLPLIAIFLEPSNRQPGFLILPRLNSWTGWWLFCGLISLAYTFFVDWKPNNLAIWIQFMPLYAILLFDLVRFYAKRPIVR
ncbi:glycosyltransferase 87 family protein [Chloroflexota bacterium]